MFFTKSNEEFDFILNSLKIENREETVKNIRNGKFKKFPPKLNLVELKRLSKILKWTS